MRPAFISSPHALLSLSVEVRPVMIRKIAVNLSILGAAFLYWLAVDYIYARNFELYHPYETMMELSFLLFVLISFDYNYKTLRILAGGTRFFVALFIPFVLSVLFLVVIYFYGIDFHILVGYLLLPEPSAGLPNM